MNDVPSWTAIVPIRGGSKGLPGKNTLKLNGIPLYMHSVNQAIKAGATRVLITTDIEEVLLAEHPAQVELYRRPDHLCMDSTPMTPVLMDVIETFSLEGIVVLLQATSPLRTIEIVKESVSVFSDNNDNLVMSVSEIDSSILKYGLVEQDRFIPISRPEYCFTNRQSLPEVYRPNGAVYVFDASWFTLNGGFTTDSIGAVIMEEKDSQDIDSINDFEICKQRMNFS